MGTAELAQAVWISGAAGPAGRRPQQIHEFLLCKNPKLKNGTDAAFRRGRAGRMPAAMDP
jgi:hypothetical protein